MGFGGGANSQSSASETASWSSQFLNAISNSDSASQGASASAIDPTQAGFLQNMWGQGQDLANPQAAIAASRRGVAGVMPGLESAFNATTALANPGQQIASQAASLKSGLGALFSDQINPAISSDAIAAGGFGGGRQGVAQGVATGKLADSYAAGLGDITANANNTALNAAATAGQLGSGIYNLGMMPTTAGFAPLAQLSSLLGSPTVLSKAWQDAMSRGRSTTRSGSESRSVGTSRSEGSGWNMNFTAPGE